jgi:hypothetical protein
VVCGELEKNELRHNYQLLNECFAIIEEKWYIRNYQLFYLDEKPTYSNTMNLPKHTQNFREFKVKVL